ncbi:MAG TPA: ABC transporter substrate-binding protein [Homoserinimonas sp.]|nr:ABC transporter substrate-binding protein [Homoserinimonas sp.]
MRTKYSIAAVAVAAALALTGCVDNSTKEPAPEDKVEVSIDEAAAALLPADIKEAGVLVAGIDLAYAPNEFKDAAGEPKGWSIDLGDAMAAKLGLTMEYKASGFDKIIPSVTGGTYDIGYSSFTDNAERQESVDFVNYYNAGIQWAQPVGGSVDPAHACGLTVSVPATTYEETDELPAKSEECVANGEEPINILKFETQDEATTAVALGRADAMSADSPITLYAVAQIKDQIEVAGEAFDVAPYGIAIAKDATDLGAALQAALQSLIDDGSYQTILESWGVASGGIEEVTINAGS